jgi:hypothetical protein
MSLHSVAPLRVAALFDAWVGSVADDGGASIRQHLIDPLGCEVFLALSHDARDRCDADQHCEPDRLLPALRPFARTSLERSPTSAELTAQLTALPHWPAIVAAHNAAGSSIACPQVRGGGYNCSGIYQGNHFLAPVLGDPRLHNLHQLWGMARALALLSDHEARAGMVYDRVIRSRLDLRWIELHPPLALLAPRYVWVPAGEDYYGGLNDRHAVLGRAAADAYFGRWASILGGRVMEVQLMPGHSDIHSRCCRVL